MLFQTSRLVLLFGLLLGTPLFAEDDKQAPSEEEKAALLEQAGKVERRLAESEEQEAAAQAGIVDAVEKTGAFQRQILEFAKRRQEVEDAIGNLDEMLKQQREAAEKAAATRDETKAAADKAKKALEVAGMKADAAGKQAEMTKRAATETERKARELAGKRADQKKGSQKNKDEQDKEQEKDEDPKSGEADAKALEKAQAAAGKAKQAAGKAGKDLEAAVKTLEAARKQADAAARAAGEAQKAHDEAARALAGSESERTTLLGKLEKITADARTPEQEVAKLQKKIRQSEEVITASRKEQKDLLRELEDLYRQAGEWVSFAEQIAPIFQQRCLACHHSGSPEGGYNMENYAAILRGGESGEAVDPGDGEFSTLCVLIEDGSMPKDADPLTEEQIALVKRWVELGARLDTRADPTQPLIQIMPRMPQPAPPESYGVPVPVTAVAISPDGSLLASSGYHEVLLWSIPEGELVRRITNVAERTYGLAFHGDGARLAVASGTPGQVGEVKLFQVGDGELLADLLISEDAMFDVAFSPDGERLAACGSNRSIHLFDLKTGEQSRVIEDHADWVSSIAWSPDGKLLVSSSRDKTAKIFDAETGAAVITFNGHTDIVTRAAFLADGKQIVSAGGDRRLRVWSLEEAKEARSMTGFGGEVTGFTVDAGNRVVSGCADRKVRVHNAADGKSVKEFSGHADWVYSVATDAELKFIASGSYDGRIHLWEIESGKSIADWIGSPGHDAAATAAAGE